MLPPRANTPTGTIRNLRHSELPQFKAHLLRLDRESRRDRFNGPTNDAFVASYADRCFHDGTVVIGYVEDGLVLGAAELHERPEEATPTGEIAFSVERALQHRGIGSHLFARLVETAASFGYEQLRVTTHPQNEAMKRLARKFEASLRFEDGETVGLITLRPAVRVAGGVAMPAMRNAASAPA